MTKMYQIEYEFQSDHNVADNTARGTTVHIRSKSDRTTVADAARWWQNRYKAIPESFRRCCSVVIFEFDPSPLDEDGYLPNMGRIRMVFQWKIQTGMGPGVTVGSNLVNNPACDMFNVDKKTPTMVGLGRNQRGPVR